jgi:type II restriction enzyme
MDWAADHYSVVWKPNTRETVRRRTLHQFAEAGLVLQNPDEPGRAINSPRWCYQLAPDALTVIRAFDRDDWSENVAPHYLERKPGLVKLYAAERAQHQIPVTLPNGNRVGLSPGGQNVLIAEIVEAFCSRWTPGGIVVYLVDAGAKWGVAEFDALADLGVTIDEHGKMPDLVVHLPDRNWLVLIEAASSHGPVDAKRYGELAELFAESTAGLVYVSAFPGRTEMRKYLDTIAWETEVWCADAPSHLIHFNGERFLGPYHDA